MPTYKEFLDKFLEKVDEVNLYPTQKEIVKSIIDRNQDKINICCYTRYGKTYAVAFGVCLYILLHDNERVKIIASKKKQSNILRDYILGFIVDIEELQHLLPLDVNRVDRLQKKMSKDKIDFTNGTNLQVLTAGGDLMGFGSDLLVIDEACKISQKKYLSEINRMIEGKVVEIGNPLHRENFFWEHYNDDRYKQIHLGYGNGALEEGRHSKEWFEERKVEYRENSRQFKILYKSEFPESSEGALINWSWIQRAIEKEVKFENETKIKYGLDVAGEGTNKNVLTKIKTDGEKYKVLEIWSWESDDTMITAGKVARKINKDEDINIDAMGIGKGVYNRLREQGYNANQVKVGEKTKDDLVLNKKAEYYWNLRTLFEEERISIIDRGRLKKDLAGIKEKYRSDQKLQIEDPGKSPDFSDSLMLACCKEGSEELLIGSYDLTK